MATISKELAEEVAANDGVYPGDPQAYVVFKYLNTFFGHECYAICWSKEEFQGYLEAHKILEVMWHKMGNVQKVLDVLLEARG